VLETVVPMTLRLVYPAHTVQATTPYSSWNFAEPPTSSLPLPSDRVAINSPGLTRSQWWSGEGGLTPFALSELAAIRFLRASIPTRQTGNHRFKYAMTEHWYHSHSWSY